MTAQSGQARSQYIALTDPYEPLLCVSVSTDRGTVLQDHPYEPLLCMYVQRNCSCKTILTNPYCVCISNGIAVARPPLLCISNELLMQDHPYKPVLCLYSQWNCCCNTTFTSPYCVYMYSGIAVPRPPLRTLTVYVLPMELL